MPTILGGSAVSVYNREESANRASPLSSPYRDHASGWGSSPMNLRHTGQPENTNRDWVPDNPQRATDVLQPNLHIFWRLAHNRNSMTASYRCR